MTLPQIAFEVHGIADTSIDCVAKESEFISHLRIATSRYFKDKPQIIRNDIKNDDGVVTRARWVAKFMATEEEIIKWGNRGKI